MPLTVTGRIRLAQRTALMAKNWDWPEEWEPNTEKRLVKRIRQRIKLAEMNVEDREIYHYIRDLYNYAILTIKNHQNGPDAWVEITDPDHPMYGQKVKKHWTKIPNKLLNDCNEKQAMIDAYVEANPELETI